MLRLTCGAVRDAKDIHSFAKFQQKNMYSFLRACLHGGWGPQVGEVTSLAVVEK